MILINKIGEYLSSLVRDSSSQISPSIGQVYCNVSPFNSDWNRLVCEYNRRKREGATKQELRQVIRDNPISSLEGKWEVPKRLPTYEENLGISGALLSRG